MLSWLNRQRRQLHGFYRSDFRNTLLCAAVAFLAVMLLSFCVCLRAESFISWLKDWFTQQVIDAGVVDADGSFSVLRLLGNNLQAMLLAIGYGFIPFLFLPALSLGINALLLGGFAAYYCINGIPLWFYIAGILPHGIFELTALVLALAGGLYLCRSITDYIRCNEKGVVGPLVKNLLRLLTLHILPLLIAAALVETYVTPALLQALAPLAGL